MFYYLANFSVWLRILILNHYLHVHSLSCVGMLQNLSSNRGSHSDISVPLEHFVSKYLIKSRIEIVTKG